MSSPRNGTKSDSISSAPRSFVAHNGSRWGKIASWLGTPDHGIDFSPTRVRFFFARAGKKRSEKLIRVWIPSCKYDSISSQLHAWTSHSRGANRLCKKMTLDSSYHSRPKLLAHGIEKSRPLSIFFPVLQQGFLAGPDRRRTIRRRASQTNSTSFSDV